MIDSRKMFNVTSIRALRWLLALIGCLAAIGLAYTYAWSGMKATIASAEYITCMECENLKMERIILEQSVFYFDYKLHDELIEQCNTLVGSLNKTLSVLVLGSAIFAACAIIAIFCQLFNLKFNNLRTATNLHEHNEMKNDFMHRSSRAILFLTVVTCILAFAPTVVWLDDLDWPVAARHLQEVITRSEQ